MKRFFALFLAICMLMLVGCNNTVPDDNPGTSAGDSDQPSIPPLKAFGYTEQDLSEIVVRDTTRRIIVDMSDNNKLKTLLRLLRYNPDEGKPGTAIVKYELTIGGLPFMVLEDNEVVYNFSKRYTVAPDLHNYLDSLFVGEVGSLDATIGENAKVHNKKGYTADVKDAAQFLADLNAVRVIALSDVTDFNFDTADYRIETGHDTIKIYGDIIVIGSRAYAVAEGDFSFLSDLEYSSSSGGFLPWI